MSLTNHSMLWIITPEVNTMRPDSLPRLWRYINLLLTYLLTMIDWAILWLKKLLVGGPSLMRHCCQC